MRRPLATTRVEDGVVGIFGAGGHGRELAWLARECLGDGVPLFFVVDQAHVAGTEQNGVPVVSLSQFSDRHPGGYIAIAIGDPSKRERCVASCRSHGLRIVSLVHPRIAVSPWVAAGEGCVVAAGAVLTTNIELGHHVHINVCCSVSHDAVIGDFSTLSPGVHLAGWVTMGRRVFVGTGAVVRNGAPGRPIIIGDDVVIGAGACIVGDVPAGATVAGVPAVPI
jgi:sugar O-acyltransferase (sialic acid O-acetyltransferase NeuD family)